MLEFLPSLGSLLSYGSVSAFSKKAITEVGRHKAIAYAYIALVILLISSALLLRMDFGFPAGLYAPYLLQIAIGGIGSIAMYKALDHGKASLIAPINKAHVLLVLMGGVMVFGEELSLLQVAGSLTVLASALLLTEGTRGWRLEPWMIFLIVSIACRAYYYTFIKTFVLALGPYMATLYLEIGVAAFIIAFHFLRGRDLSPPGTGLAFPVASGTLIFIGSLLYSLSVGLIGAALTAAISAASPIINMGVAYALLGERLDRRRYAAIGLLVIGLLLILR